MPVAIRGTGGGSVTLSSGAAAADTTLTLPNTTGTVALTAGHTFTGTVTIPTLSVTGTSTLTGTVTATTITSPASTALTIQSAGTTAMTVDTSQNVLVNCTATPSSTVAGWLFNNGVSRSARTTSASSDHILWINSNGTVGAIGTTGTSTYYNTSSDYRLKENVTPMTNALTIVKALKPVTYDWISDKSVGEGFIAHELQAVIPHAVTGEKDAVDEEGNIKPQGVDYSKIVVHLVAAIQELSAKNDALEARLAALEAK